MAANITVRTATSGDVEAIQSVARRSWDAAYERVLDDEVVGYANGEPGEEAADAEVSVYVDPEYWGEGIGSRLLAEATDFLAEQGIERVRDSVLAENEVGNAFYERHFEQVDQHEVDILGDTFTANVYAGDIA